MAKRQTNFNLEQIRNGKVIETNTQIILVDNDSPFLAVVLHSGEQFYVKDKDLERLARNILKSLGKS